MILCYHIVWRFHDKKIRLGHEYVSKIFSYPKNHNSTTVTENTTIQEVYDIFDNPDNAHTRTMPILDESGRLFRGNIYKQHVFEHIAKGGDMSLPATAIMRNSTKFIYTTSKFYEVFFAIRDLPFYSCFRMKIINFMAFSHTML